MVNIDEAVNLHALQNPERCPLRRSFDRIVKQFSQDGSVQTKWYTWRKTATDENNDVRVLAAVAHNLAVSIRLISRGSKISRKSV